MRVIRFHARDGLELAATEWPGPEARTPILCLPGLTRSAADFSPLAERHAATRRVVALDHAGHGESARPAAASRYSIPESLRDVTDAMAALHLPRVAIVGTSYGGILTMVLAVLRPTAIAAAVLNDIGPRIEDVGLDHVQSFVGRDPALPDLDAAVEFLREKLEPLTLDEAGWRRFAANTFRADEAGVYRPRWDVRIAEVLRAAGKAPDLWPAFGALAHAPLMTVRGEVSAMLSPETTAQMRQARPDMAFVEVPGTGHSPTLEEAAVVPALDAFLHGVP